MLSRLPAALQALLFCLAAQTHAAPGLRFVAEPQSLSPRSGTPDPTHIERNGKPLPAQLCGIVGGYLLAVLIWGVLLLTIGRRMRRKSEMPPPPLEVELVNAKAAAAGKNPLSPGSARSPASWLKKHLKKDSGVNSPVTSPTSVNSFDQKVVEADRERAQVEMERLYAAVMEHDRKKSLTSINTEEAGDNRPSAINTSTQPENVSRSNPGSPRTIPIYPPDYNPHGPPTAPLPRDRLRDDQPPESPRSFLSSKSKKSSSSTGSKTRFNLKNLRIGGAAQKFASERARDEERTPLTPEFYNKSPMQPTPSTVVTSPDDDEAYERLDEVQPLPRPAPQRTGSYANGNQPSPTKLSTSNQGANALPLRGYAEPLKSPELRTTYVDRRMDQLSMTTPKTGVPFTPYSPYMPFTPVTPVTPHLVTKKERKAVKKASRKAGRSDDMVQSPKEIFGDAY